MDRKRSESAEWVRAVTERPDNQIGDGERLNAECVGPNAEDFAR